MYYAYRIYNKRNGHTITQQNFKTLNALRSRMSIMIDEQTEDLGFVNLAIEIKSHIRKDTDTNVLFGREAA